MGKIYLHLKNRFVGTRSGSIDQRIPGRSAVPVRATLLHKQVFESLSELAGHPAVNSKVNGVAENDEEIREQYQHIGYIVI